VVKKGQKLVNVVYERPLHFFEKQTHSRGLGKLGRQGVIFWLKKELSWKLGTLHIFQHLFDKGFRETSKNFSSFRQLLFPIVKMSSECCLNKLKFCEVS
jgi:hypothetical protein